MDTDGDGTVTKEVRYLIQILNSRWPIHILFRLKLIHLKTINLNFKLKSIYQIAEKIDIIFPIWNTLMSVRKERKLEVREYVKKTPQEFINCEKLFTKQFTKMCQIFCNFQEFISICKNLSEEQVTEAFNKYDTSGDNK